MPPEAPGRRRVNPRTVLAIGHDAVATIAAWWLAFALRFNLELPADYVSVALAAMPCVTLLQVALFLGFGLYRGLWRYASLHDLRLILLAVGAAALAAPAGLVLVRLSAPIPRSVFLLDPLLLLTLMGGSRLAYRAWKERRPATGAAAGLGVPVLVLGAGDTADKLLRELDAKREWRIVGLLDDDPRKQGRHIHGIPVLGPLDAVAGVAARVEVGHAIIALPSATHQVRREAVRLAKEAGLRVMTVPSFDDIMSGRVTVSQLRDVELDDLLGRDPVVLDSQALAGFLSGNVVLVTGAGGSIGSELCRQIARFHPATLVLVELSEFALYGIEQEFRSRYPEVALICAVGDAKDPRRMGAILARYQPQVLFHAGAYKHVPLMEEVNAWEAVRNNVGGTLNMARLAMVNAVQTFVLVSTDKAVNPVNVMGGSKRLAETVCQALQEEGSTRFVIVRFGNVLGSAGSVVPKFRQQIATGGPITVTHPEITRYFMSIPEATQLMLQAAAMGRGGEIFVLDMGEPVRIVDLAREMIRLSGVRDGEISIVFSGLRPGEKLYEEVLADDEQTLPTPHPKLRIARSRAVPDALLDEVQDWLEGGVDREDTEVRQGLAHFVPEYVSAPARDSAH